MSMREDYEEWATIPETKYEISSWGDVRVRLKSGGTKPHRIMERSTGVQYVTLRIDGRIVERRIDDLVREYFGKE